MLQLNLFPIFVLSSCFAFVFSENTVVSLPSGTINGREVKTFQNTTFYAFQEVPYAAPPLGNLRFRDPVPVENWEGVLNTTNNTKICAQNGTDPRQSEDCLYLNVYTPVVPGTEANLPVLVFIHGGGFVGGSDSYNDLGPEFFMDTGKLVVVTINYRLGIFGVNIFHIFRDSGIEWLSKYSERGSVLGGLQNQEVNFLLMEGEIVCKRSDVSIVYY